MNGVQYSNNSALKLTHMMSESLQYHCMKASVNLAKEKGRCKGFENTKYARGSLPIDADRHKDYINRLVDENGGLVLLQDWEELRSDIAKYGIRNATLTAFMPSETSSQISNATNGIEPPRDYISHKSSKDGIMKQVVPDIEDPIIKFNYELLWDQKSPRGYIQNVGVMQKFVDQTISANTSYNPAFFEDNKLPIETLLGDLLYCYKCGVKTGYYFNTNDRLDNEDDDCEGGACKI